MHMPELFAVACTMGCLSLLCTGGHEDEAQEVLNCTMPLEQGGGRSARPRCGPHSNC